MASTLPATGKVTFTITTMPRTAAAKKTLARLMRLNPATQRMLTKLSRIRVNTLNRRTARAGRIWLSRAPATKLINVAVGETFTLTMTPQLLPDVKSVEKYLTPKAK